MPRDAGFRQRGRVSVRFSPFQRLLSAGPSGGFGSRPCDNRSRPAMQISGADKGDRVSRPDRCDQRPHSEQLDHPLQVICQYVQAQLRSDFR